MNSPRIQWIRHGLQGTILVGLVCLAGLAGYRAIHAADPGPPGAEQVFFDHIRGNTWSLQIGPLSLLDPLGGVESVAASRSVGWIVLSAIALPVLVTVIAGRVFCSWVCPVGFVLELADRLRARSAAWSGRRRRNLGFWRGSKYILLLSGLALSAIAATPILSLFYPPAVFVRELHQWILRASDISHILGSGITWATPFLLAILGVEMLISRRWWCRYLCPGGALYSLFGAGRLLRVSSPDQHCDRCGECVTACGMGLNPMAGLTGSECDNCLACMSACPPDALHPILSMPGRKP